MNKIESAPSPHDTNPLRRLAGTRTGRLAVVFAGVTLAAGCIQGVHGNTNTVPAASVAVDVLHGRDLLCMQEETNPTKDQTIFDCDWPDYDKGTTPHMPRSATLINLSESDEHFGSGATLECLQFPLANSHIGKTCDWWAPGLQGKTPAYPIQTVEYDGRDILCLSEKTAQDYQYSCGIDATSEDYEAPFGLTRISSGTLVEHTQVEFDNTKVTALVYNEGSEGQVGEVVDWATFHPAK